MRTASLTNVANREIVAIFMMLGAGFVAFWLHPRIGMTPNMVLFYIMSLGLAFVHPKLALILYVIILPFTLERPDRPFDFLRFDEIFLGAIILATLPRITVRRFGIPQSKTLLILIVSYFFYLLFSFISLLQGSVGFKDLFSLGKDSIKLLLFFLGLYYVVNRRDVTIFVVATFIIGLIVAIIGALQYLNFWKTVELINQHYPKITSGAPVFSLSNPRASSVLGNPNICAIFLSLHACILFSILLSRKRLGGKDAFIIAALTLDIVIIFLTRSRTGVLVIGIGLGILTIYKQHFKMTALIMLIGTVIYFALPQRTFARWQNLHLDLQDRIQVETRAWGYSATNLPLGGGPTYRGPVWVESTYGWILSQRGVIGLFFFFLIVGSVIILLWKSHKYRIGIVHPLSLGMLAWFLSLFPAAFTGDYFFANKMAEIFWLLLGVVVATSKPQFNWMQKAHTSRHRMEH